MPRPNSEKRKADAKDSALDANESVTIIPTIRSIADA